MASVQWTGTVKNRAKKTESALTFPTQAAYIVLFVSGVGSVDLLYKKT